MKKVIGIITAVGIVALTAGFGFVVVLYEVGKQMNQYRSCGGKRT